jgi:dTMP kinase
MIDAYLKNACELDDRAVHLLFSANRWEAASQLKKKLASGVTLVVDRYAFSGVCYTAAKEGQTLGWCKQPDVGLPKPDVVFFLDIPMDEAAKRGDYGAERYEKQEFQTKVRSNFLRVADDDWKILDATKPIEELHEIVYRACVDVQAAVGSRPIGTLWTDAPGSAGGE